MLNNINVIEEIIIFSGSMYSLGLWYKKDVQPSTWSIKTPKLCLCQALLEFPIKKTPIYTFRYGQAIYWFYDENISSKTFYIVTLTFWIRKIELNIYICLIYDLNIYIWFFGTYEAHGLHYNLLFDDGALPSTVDLAAPNRNRVIPLLWITAIRILPANPSMGLIKLEFI